MQPTWVSGMFVLALGCGNETVRVSAGPAPRGAALTTSAIQKVFYIMEENRNASDVYGAGDAPYINGTLMTTYEYASNYTDVVHPSEPNYIWLEAGDDLGLTTDSDPDGFNSTSSTDHLVNDLGRVGRTWKSYQEDLPGSCGIYSSYPYAAKHNAFVFFQDVVGDYDSPSAFCTDHIVDLSALAQDIATNNLADFIEITHKVVPGIGEDSFRQEAQTAKANCPVSKALAGVPEITLDARLAN